MKDFPIEVYYIIEEQLWALAFDVLKNIADEDSP